MPNFDDVLQFHRKMGLPVGDFRHPSLLSTKEMRHRLNFLLEELTEMSNAAELVESLEGDSSPHAQDLRTKALAEIFDGLLDLVYVACGTGVMMGLPWEEGYDLVQQANMAKVRIPTDGSEHHHGVMKPEGWKKPDIKGLIASVRAGEIRYVEKYLSHADAHSDAHADTAHSDVAYSSREEHGDVAHGDSGPIVVGDRYI